MPSQSGRGNRPPETDTVVGYVRKGGDVNVTQAMVVLLARLVFCDSLRRFDVKSGVHSDGCSSLPIAPPFYVILPLHLPSQDILGKVAKLLGNDLSKAEEEYAENLKTYRLYFKALRSKEEGFSTLKKNKDSLQKQIDTTEKKLAKMSPENKDLANVTHRLGELKNEMIGMEHSVLNEEAAVSDFRRQQSRAALLHKVSTVCLC